MVGSTVVIIVFASSSAMMTKLPLLFCHVETKVLELCVNQDISLHIVKPFDAVSPLQRQQWVSQVLTACPATTTMHTHTTIGKTPGHRLILIMFVSIACLPVCHCSDRSRHEVLTLVQACSGAPRPEASERAAERAHGGQNRRFRHFQKGEHSHGDNWSPHPR